MDEILKLWPLLVGVAAGAGAVAVLRSSLAELRRAIDRLGAEVSDLRREVVAGAVAQARIEERVNGHEDDLRDLSQHKGSNGT